MHKLKFLAFCVAVFLVALTPAAVRAARGVKLLGTYPDDPGTSFRACLTKL